MSGVGCQESGKYNLREADDAIFNFIRKLGIDLYPVYPENHVNPVKIALNDLTV